MATQRRHAKRLEDLEIGVLLPVAGSPLLEQPAPDPSHLRPQGRVGRGLPHLASDLTGQSLRSHQPARRGCWPEETKVKLSRLAGIRRLVLTRSSCSVDVRLIDQLRSLPKLGQGRLLQPLLAKRRLGARPVLGGDPRVLRVPDVPRVQ
jgi:hypothetical protein